MLLSRRSFERREPERDAKCVYIFCEGSKREYQYFDYFVGLSEKIKVEIYPIDPNSEDHSPKGLYDIACNSLKQSDENPNPKYELSDVDEVWIVFDKDPDKYLTREPQISKVNEFCRTENDLLKKENVWNVAESNPCFEVWLYYHFKDDVPKFEEIDVSSKWKQIVNDVVNGGFDSQRHPSLI